MIMIIASNRNGLEVGVNGGILENEMEHTRGVYELRGKR